MAETNITKYRTAERLGKMDVDLIDVTPTCDTSGTDDADVLFDYVEIPNCVSVAQGSGLLHSIQLLDIDDVGGAIDLVFQTDSTSLGTVDAAVSIADADAADILGYVSLSSYFDGIAWQMSTKTNIGLVMKAASGTSSIYVAGVNRNGASVTHTASGIVLRIGIIKD